MFDHLLSTIVIDIVFIGQLKVVWPYLGNSRRKQRQKLKAVKKQSQTTSPTKRPPCPACVAAHDRTDTGKTPVCGHKLPFLPGEEISVLWNGRFLPSKYRNHSNHVILCAEARMKTVDQIHKQLTNGEFSFSHHAFRRAVERNISEVEMFECHVCGAAESHVEYVSVAK